LLYIVESEVFGLAMEESRYFRVALFGGYILMTSMIGLVTKLVQPEQQSKQNIWVLYIGNMATLLCVLFALYTTLVFFGSSWFSLPFILPFLLLLQQDDFLFSWLTPQRRYLPVLLVFYLIVDLLVILTIIDLAQYPPENFIDNLYGIVAIEIIALVFALAPQVFIMIGSNTYPFLPSALPLVLTLPLCFISLIMTYLDGTRLLAIVDVVAGMVLWLSSSRKAQTARE